MTATRKRKLSFEEWMKEIDRQCSIKGGCGIHDLPDCNFLDWWEDGMTPRAAITKAIRRAKCEE